MRIAALLLIAGMPAAAADSWTVALDEAARVASVMVDGDLCQRIVTPRAWEYMFQENPRDRFLSSDNYDVDDQAFLAVKKTLIRIGRLVPFPADANLWLPVPGHPDKIHVTIRNAHELSQFWPWGALYQEMPAPMKTVLETGRRITVTAKPGWISVLSPVHNSLGDIVGLVEVAAQRTPDAHANVK
ncbi:MAG TPA: hypothetical protein VFA33_12655 [Bryobacteraceae bacterium]|nr:hypothetical protein [Bryobacteraceae bacterium]